jgi:type II secretory ATPase GspE/PulE/Tfp pilus assembly ATPase PilB-like protein
MSSLRDDGAELFRREYDLDNPLVGLPPIANLCNALLADALRSQAQKIRLVSMGPQLGNVEYDIASEWRVIAQVPNQAFGSFINRLKVMSALDIGRAPVQEGELRVRLNGQLHRLKIRTEATSAPYELVTITGLPGSAT